MDVPSSLSSGALAWDSSKVSFPKRDLLVVLAAWLLLSSVLAIFTGRLVSNPILYYDEALPAAMAKDFVIKQHRSVHMVGTATLEVFGRPMPTFLQGYIGALKPWMLIPTFEVFGPTLKVLRWTNLGLGLISLLLLMLWTWRLLGQPAALLAGSLLALDPSFFFTSVYDWGPVAPSYICRMAGFLLVLLWWQGCRPVCLFFAGLSFGLGFFGKLDFVVILAGTGLALLITYTKAIITALATARGKLALFCAGFLLGGAPMIANFFNVVRGVLSGESPSRKGEMVEKLNTAWTMLDGSYFYRLMDQGGIFTRMFDSAAAVWSPFGLVFAMAFLVLAVRVSRGLRRHSFERLPAFLLASVVLLLAGVLLLPQAVRLHHWTLVYPFPHLIIAAAALGLWHNPPMKVTSKRAVRVAVALAIAGVLVGHLLAIQKTQRLIQETGGRGWWSSALDAFAAEVRTRTDLTLVSYDWGFHESLAFLTDGPRLEEPIWDLLEGKRHPISTRTNIIYLVHPPEYRFCPLSTEVFKLAYRRNLQEVLIREYKDRQGETVFYTIRFLKE